MAFIRKQGKTKLMWLPMTITNAVGVDHLVAFSSGRLIEAASSTASYSIVGVLRHAITSASDEYTTAADVEVEVPVEKNVVWEADVTSGLVVADVGLYVDLTDGDHINRGATTYDIATCVKVISTTKGWFILNIGADAKEKA